LQNQAKLTLERFLASEDWRVKDSLKTSGEYKESRKRVWDRSDLRLSDTKIRRLSEPIENCEKWGFIFKCNWGGKRRRRTVNRFF
jgi:hypothetical protein